MSTFVARYPVIRALLQRYREHNIEYTAVAPFQTAFCALFPVAEGYAVNMEQSVDRDRYRVDLYVQGLDFDHGTLYPILVGEGKGGGKSPREVESQVLARSLDAIDGNKLNGIFAFTWLGESFRVWRVSAIDRTLQPLDSATPCGSRSAYILLDSQEGECIVDLTSNMKVYRPVQVPPVVPSQKIPPRSQTHQSPKSPVRHENNTYSVDPPAAAQSNPHEDLEDWQDQEMEVDHPSVVTDTEVEAGPSTGHSHGGHGQTKSRSREVTIEKRENGNGYKFVWKDKKDKIKTEREDWEKNGDTLTLRKRYRGYHVWGRKP